MTVDVPVGSELIGIGDLACLKTPDGTIHTAQEVFLFANSNAAGFQLLD